jgi:hypothetical protein
MSYPSTPMTGSQPSAMVEIVPYELTFARGPATPCTYIPCRSPCGDEDQRGAFARPKEVQRPSQAHPARRLVLSQIPIGGFGSVQSRNPTIGWTTCCRRSRSPSRALNCSMASSSPHREQTSIMPHSVNRLSAPGYSPGCSLFGMKLPHRGQTRLIGFASVMSGPSPSGSVARSCS